MDSELSSRLTILFITSPSVGHPSTGLLEEVAWSFSLVPGLVQCPKIVVADGYRVADKYIWKQGKVTEEYAQRYRLYLARVHSLTLTEASPLYGADLLALQRRHGFAHAVRRGLGRVTTQYVMVAQHDRSIMRKVDVSAILDTMDRNPEVKCVGLLTRALLNYTHLVASKHHFVLSDVQRACIPMPHYHQDTSSNICANDCQLENNEADDIAECTHERSHEGSVGRRLQREGSEEEIVENKNGRNQPIRGVTEGSEEMKEGRNADETEIQKPSVPRGHSPKDPACRAQSENKVTREPMSTEDKDGASFDFEFENRSNDGSTCPASTSDPEYLQKGDFPSTRGEHDSVVEYAPRMIPLLQFSDSLHVASVQHYRETVFGKNRKINLHGGVFLEDVYGQRQLADLRSHGFQSHAYYGTYLFQDGIETPMVGHLDGHDPLTRTSDYVKYRWSSSHFPENLWKQKEEEIGFSKLSNEPMYEILEGFLDLPIPDEM